MLVEISDTLILRPFVDGDRTAFADAVVESQHSLSPWLPWAHAAYTPDHAAAWFRQCAQDRENGSADEIGIFRRDDCRLLGGVGIHQINRQHGFAGLGYWVRRTAQWRGVASLAAAAMARHAFMQHGLTRLEIVAAESNLASRRVAEKIGARHEGIACNRLRLGGRLHDAIIYSLIP
jgi:ribosomal-protein-serine acetyltransferase